MSKYYYYRAVFLFAVMSVSVHFVKAQTQPNLVAVVPPGHEHKVGIIWNATAITNNYPLVQLGLLYIYRNTFSLEVSGGKVYDSETYIVSNELMNHISGYKMAGEFKYYLGLNSSQKGLFVGIGASHLISEFRTAYVIRKELLGDRFYQNVDPIYTTTLNQYYAKVGYSSMTPGKRLFFEFGVNLGIVKKNLTPTVDDKDGRILNNLNFVHNYHQFPFPLSVDIKLCYLIFK